MLESSKELSNEHTFGSRPSWWPLMRRGVAFWIAKDNNVKFCHTEIHIMYIILTKPDNKTNYDVLSFFQAQIFCIGNPFVWWVTTLSLPVYFGLLIFYLLRRRRKVYDLSKGRFSKHLTFNLIYLNTATFLNKKVCYKSVVALTETFQAQIANLYFSGYGAHGRCKLHVKPKYIIDIKLPML